MRSLGASVVAARRRSLFVAVAGAAVAIGAAAAAENWPRFRGPRADGASADDPRWPEVWDASQGVVWQAEIPGLGWSSPIVWGDRVVVTAVVSDAAQPAPRAGLYQGEGVRTPEPGLHRWLVLCFDLARGELLWQREVHAGEPTTPRHPKSSYAAETPTTDGTRVYALFGDLGLYALELASGELVWQQPIEPRKTFYDYGAAASPVVHQGQVIVVYDNLEASWIAAFDAASGAVRWKQPRDETHSWATPFVWEHAAGTEIVVPGQRRNRGYALDGQLQWEFDGRMSNLVIPSPFAAHGMCYLASGYIGDAQRPTFALLPGARGDLTPPAGGDFADHAAIGWHQPQSAPYNTSQLVYGDYLYTLYDQGFLTCHDARTGAEVYGKQRFRPSGSFTASPWAYNGYVFCLSEDGRTYVVQAGPEFAVVATSALDALCLATPAAADGKLLLRTAQRLLCLSGGPRAADAGTSADVPAADLWTAAREGQADAVRAALDGGTAADARPPGGGETALVLAVLHGHAETARLLLDRGADVAQKSYQDNTPLHIAAFLAHPDLVQLLRERGAPADARNAQGQTPRELAAAPWTEELAGFYRLVENLLGIPLDLQRIRQTRAAVAAQLE